MHARGHEDVTTHRRGTRGYNHGQQAPEGHPLHMLGQGAHCISLLDWYGSPTKCKKVRSCNTYEECLVDHWSKKREKTVEEKSALATEYTK